MSFKRGFPGETGISGWLVTSMKNERLLERRLHPHLSAAEAPTMFAVNEPTHEPPICSCPGLCDLFGKTLDTPGSVGQPAAET